MAEQSPAWQEKKHSERIRYALDNEIGTDVCFEVGPPEGNVGLVRAHKAFLLVYSPVFEAMFTGNMAEAGPDYKDNIRIPDIDITTFKEMLRYIYCETANITADTVFPLMYAAKKYLLTELVKECRKVVEKGLNVTTVCSDLEQIISFHDENELRLKCLEFIAKNARHIFSSREFLHISRDALEEIICLDSLPCNERRVYEYCLKWASHQLQEAGTESPSDEQIRDKLDNVLYRIRFPAMSQKDFAELTAESKVLTEEEKNSIFVYMTSGKRLESLKFVVQKRQIEENVVNLWCRIVSDSLNPNAPMAAVRFMTTSDIHLTGVGLYGVTGASTHNVTVTVSKGVETLATTQVTMTSAWGTQEPIKVELKEPIHIHANTLYTVWAGIIVSSTWVEDVSGNTRELAESGRMTFSSYTVPTNKLHVQIPQLFYYI